MYTNKYFDNFPKIFLVLSLTFNSIFIYLNLSDPKKILGKYRYFLLSFSIFNVCYSTVEAVIPVAVYGSNYVIIIYLAGGPFFQNLDFGELAVSIRCGFISLSYGILTIHFVYRYVALFNPSMIEKLTSKRGVLGLVSFFFAHGIVWATTCETTLHSTTDAQDIVRSEFLTLLHSNISEIPFINILYRSPNISTVIRCWLGILIVSTISISSITVYCVLGYKIFKKLRVVNQISNHTRKLHRQLFVTLAVQTTIPTVLSFLPCMFVWFIPFFGFYLGSHGNVAVIALSAFPSLDAVAVMILLPFYRNRFKISRMGPSAVKVNYSLEIL